MSSLLPIFPSNPTPQQLKDLLYRAYQLLGQHNQQISSLQAAQTTQSNAQAQTQAQASVIDVPLAIPGMPTAGNKYPVATVSRKVGFKAQFAGSYGSVGTNPTAAQVMTLNKNGSAIGTVSVSTAGVVTFGTGGHADVTLSPGDRLTLTAPVTQDATMANLSITLVGTAQ